MRLGKVKLNLEYVVDLDNESMVVHAKDSIIEDVYNAVTFNEVPFLIAIDDKYDNLSEKDIPTFLKNLESDN